jgi:hypothetical protein
MARKLRKADADKAVERVAKLLPELRTTTYMMRQVAKELGERDHNNMYLHDDALAYAILADILANRINGLVTAVDTVSWREG